MSYCGAVKVCVRLKIEKAYAGRLRSLHNASGDGNGAGHMIADDKAELLVKSESLKDLMSRSQDSRGTLAFLKSRETQLGVLSMVLLVFQGTALSLVLRYSRLVPPPPTFSELRSHFVQQGPTAHAPRPKHVCFQGRGVAPERGWIWSACTGPLWFIDTPRTLIGNPD